MEAIDSGPNVVLRLDADGRRIVVLAFPYDAHVVDAVRRIPGRRFDWDRREWFAPAEDWVGVHVADILARFPELEAAPDVAAWLGALRERWIGRVVTTRHDARGWFELQTRAGPVPAALGAIEAGGRTLAAMTA